MKNIQIIFAFIVLSSVNLYSQFSGDDIKGYVGEGISIEIKYSGNFLDGQERLFEADLFLSNPTVFYPLQFYSGENTSILKDSIIRISDSTYKISMLLKVDDDYKNGETVFKLSGELLAGNDSVCSINFSNIAFGNSAMYDFSLVVKSSSASGFINYVRFARIIEYYPNPVNVGNKTHWVYQIDKNSIVKFYLYDLEMKRILIQNLGIVEKGINTFEFIPDRSLSAGNYWFGMESNSGYVYKQLTIIK